MVTGSADSSLVYVDKFHIRDGKQKTSYILFTNDNLIVYLCPQLFVSC